MNEIANEVRQCVDQIRQNTVEQNLQSVLDNLHWNLFTCPIGMYYQYVVYPTADVLGEKVIKPLITQLESLRCTNKNAVVPKSMDSATQRKADKKLIQQRENVYKISEKFDIQSGGSAINCENLSNGDFSNINSKNSIFNQSYVDNAAIGQSYIPTEISETGNARSLSRQF